MSSATSIEPPKARLKPGTPPQPETHAGLTPGQFFLLVGLGCATAATVMARGQSVTAIILLTLLIGSTVLVGIAALRTLNPLVTEEDDRTAVVGGRTRAALEREKVLVLRAIKELEFDRAMGKVSDSDFDEMSGRLRSRAARLIRRLDAGAGYREQIERDLAKRLGDESPAGETRGATLREPQARPDQGRGTSRSSLGDAGDDREPAERPGSRACACGTSNDPDAKFCKACGRQL